MGPVPIALVQLDTSLDASYMEDLAEAMTVVSQRDFALAPPLGWGIGALCRVASGMADVAPGEWVLTFSTHPDVPNALGYHDTTASGKPMMHVYPTLESLEDLSVTVSHEIFEALADPLLNTIIVGQDGVLRALEVCDPVETESYTYTCRSGRVMKVSNYVLPAYFSPTPGETATGVQQPSAPYDKTGTINAPGQILPGGYQLVYSPGSHSWDQTYGMADGHPYGVTPRAYRWEAWCRGLSRNARRCDRMERRA